MIRRLARTRTGELFTPSSASRSLEDLSISISIRADLLSVAGDEGYDLVLTVSRSILQPDCDLRSNCDT